jgi:hypothetical protein
MGQESFFNSGIMSGSRPPEAALEPQPLASQPQPPRSGGAELIALVEDGLEFNKHYFWGPDGMIVWADGVTDEQIAASSLPRYRDPTAPVAPDPTDSADIDLRLRVKSGRARLEGHVEGSASDVLQGIAGLATAATAGQQPAPAPAYVPAPAPAAKYQIPPAQPTEIVTTPPTRKLGRKPAERPAAQPAAEPAYDEAGNKINLLERIQNRKRMHPSLRKFLLKYFVVLPLATDALFAVGMTAATKPFPFQDIEHGVIVNYSHFPFVDAPWTAYERIRHPKKILEP